MRKYLLLSLLLFASIVKSQYTKDTIILDNAIITPFIKDKNFIENKGKPNTISVHSNAGIITKVNLKKDIKLRAIEFFFEPTSPELCQEFIVEILLFTIDNQGNFIKVANSPENYYFINPAITTNKIFDLRNSDLNLKKEIPYYIGLYFSPADNCSEFKFQGFRKKKAKSYIDLDFKNNSRIMTVDGNGIAYRIF